MRDGALHDLLGEVRVALGEHVARPGGADGLLVLEPVGASKYFALSEVVRTEQVPSEDVVLSEYTH